MTTTADIGPRRIALGLTKAAAARLAGLSRSAWHGIEAGQHHALQPGTMHKIEGALQWPAGTLAGTPVASNGHVDSSEILRRLDEIETDIRLLKRALR